MGIELSSEYRPSPSEFAPIYRSAEHGFCGGKDERSLLSSASVLCSLFDSPILKPDGTLGGRLPRTAYRCSRECSKPLAPGPSFIIERTTPAPVKPRVFDRTFAFLTVMAAAATVADVELTANCLKTAANCRESNPLMGKDPSRGRMYGVNVPIFAGEMMVSRMLRRKSPERKSWMMPPLALTGMHTVGAASNLWAR